MSSPYKILGIEPSATDEEVKAAYRNLAKKYHPDNYTNSPLADLAEEKMKEINEAYSTIMKRRQQKKNNSNQNNEDYSYDESYSDPELERVRMKIDERDYIGAEALLNEIGRDENKRSSEWYFLMGTIYEKRGWYFEAYKMFSTASNMDPNNPKYQYAMQRMQGKRTDNNGDDMRQFGRTATSCCSTLLCTDCCCECFGGDLIKCC